MRDNRTARGGAAVEEGGAAYPTDTQADYQYQYQYAEQQPAGFTRHQTPNARKLASHNPVSDAAGRVGGAISGLFSRSRSAQQTQSSVERPRVGELFSEAGDYLGVGEACRVCGNPVDPDATRCPTCGAFVVPLYRNVKFIVAVAIAVVLVVILSIAINSCSSSAPEQDATEDEGSDTTVAVADSATLSAAVASAQSTLDVQAQNRTYSRYSIGVLQSAVDAANTVISNTAATSDQIASAAESVSSAMSALVAPLADAEGSWIDYGAVSANIAGYVGQQFAVNGTIQALTLVDGDVSNSAMVVAVSGDVSMLICIDFRQADVSGDLGEGVDVTVTGTVSGEYDGLPVLLADHVETV